jgi:alkylation response protein AidB-like acyl-CoA dehydrogenase
MTLITATTAQDDRALLVDGVREFARHELLPAAPLLDRGDPERSAHCWEQVCRLGIDRALLHEDAGGSSVGAGAWLAVLEELAAAEAGVALAVALNNLALLALSAQDAAAVPPSCRWALATLAEEAMPGAGAGAGIVAGLIGARGADGIVLISPSTPAGAALLPGDGGWSVAPDRHQLGLRAAPAGDLTLQGPRPASLRDDLDVAELRALLLAATAAIALGVARRAHELALEYAGFRRQGGGPIGRYGAVRQMLAGMEVRLRARPRLPFEDPGDGAPLAAALAAKVAATEAAGATTVDAVQVFGGSGYVRDSGVEKLMRDAKCLELYPLANWRARAELAAREPRLPAAEPGS